MIPFTREIFVPWFERPYDRRRLNSCLLTLFLFASWLVVVPFGLAQSGRKILLLHMGNTQLPVNTLVSRTIEDGLETSNIPHAIFDEYLDENRLPSARSAIAAALQAKYGGTKLDLIIASGPEAFAFLLEYGNRLWPHTPKLYCLVGVKDVPASLPAGITGVAGSLDFSPTIDLALQLQPALKNVYYIGGATPQELGRQRISQENFRRFNGLLNFTYLNKVPWRDLLQQIHHLPPHSAVLFTTYFMDPAGRPFTTLAACPSITTAANAPVYVPFDMLLHCGAIGGSVYGISASAQAVTRLAVRVLKGEAISPAPVQEEIANQIVLDKRQLDRWKIPEDRIPANAMITGRAPQAWDPYTRYLLPIAAILLLQLIAIFFLLRERRRKKRGDLAVRLLSRRVIEVAEEERRHIARELHDDMGQRLSLISFQLDSLNAQSHNGNSAATPRLDEPLQELSTLITDVHKLSHRLHSSKLEHLGLKVAMTELCQHFSQKYGLAITFSGNAIPSRMRGEAALCFYRVAQEALMNVVKHSHAQSAQIMFYADQARIRMKLADTGRGFDRASAPIGLGLTAMEERVRALDGVFTLHSRPGSGTTILIEIPSLTATNLEVSATL